MKKVQTCLITIHRYGTLIACDPSDFSLSSPKTKEVFRYIELDNQVIQFYAVPINIPLILSYSTAHMEAIPSAFLYLTSIPFSKSSSSIEWSFSTDKDVTIDVKAFN